MKISSRINKILEIANCPPYELEIKDYIIFTDNWITNDIKKIINQKKEEYNILDCKFITDEITNPIIFYPNESKESIKIRIKIATREIKRTCLKLDKLPNINDIFYCIY
jgi:hypothetical protein